VLIEPRFSGVNPADTLQREGRHPVPAGSPADIPGLEVAGTVVATGPDATAFAVGDRVFGLVGGGGHATRVVANERELARVPDALDDKQAAAVPEAFLTAFDAAVLQAGLQSGDMLLVNGASGGVGTAAVQIARALGARVVANVRNQSLRPRVAELGAEVFAADEAFARVQALGGADVVLELVGAPHMEGNIASIARGGRVIVVGAKPGDEAAIDLRALMQKRGRLMATTLRTRPAEEKGALLQAFARRIVPFLADGTMAPLIDRTFPLDDAADALDEVREPGKLGKLLLEMPG
jgi:NADPH:quinone reductase-like Zn-dependent oxidoreductase